jgi:putative tryptophan/tyrosine transport system substrate-binding protein
MTGVTNFEYAMGGKWLELLKQIAPRISSIAVLVYPGMVAHEGLWRTIETAAPGFAVEARAIPVRGTAEIESAIAAAAIQPNTGLILLPHAIIETTATTNIGGGELRYIMSFPAPAKYGQSGQCASR